MWPIRVLSSVAFLSVIIFTIPLTFDVGGRTCGLAYSLALSIFYFYYSALRLATPDYSRIRWLLVKLTALFQWLVIPALMIWSLNKFSIDSDARGSWLERTFDSKSDADKSLLEWLSGPGGLIENVFVGSWDNVLRWSTPVFQVGEGFCTLLVIQACGQITKWLVNRERGDTWMIALLIFSASTISSSVYFLWRITKFPEIDTFDAILIGAAIMGAVILCSWGIGSGRGNPVESSLLFAYVVLCIYQIFTDYMPSSGKAAAVESPSQPALPPLPPVIMASYTTLLQALHTLPTTVHSAFNFTVAAIMTITPSVIISLAYRVCVMYAATRIIPAVRGSGRALSHDPSLDDSDDAVRVLGFVTWFSPSIIIAVYTNLLMQHFASSNVDSPAGEWWQSQGGFAGGNTWRWVNLAFTMGMYAIELYFSREDDGSRLTSHWKSD